VYVSSPRPCALGFVSPGFESHAPPTFRAYIGAAREPILEDNGGLKVVHGHYYEGRERVCKGASSPSMAW
jgi:hypothetical protein